MGATHHQVVAERALVAEAVEVALLVEVRVQVGHLHDGRRDLRVAQDLERLVADHLVVDDGRLAPRLVVRHHRRVHLRRLQEECVSEDGSRGWGKMAAEHRYEICFAY